MQEKKDTFVVVFGPDVNAYLVFSDVVQICHICSWSSSVKSFSSGGAV